MEPREGRSPYPKGGDPNVKTVRLALTPEEWRNLRLWAAQDSTSIETVLKRIVRDKLSSRQQSSRA
jgi:hypothetical protein